MNQIVKWGNVFTFAGAIVAYLIGSGFASGQEAMQFFTSFGVKGAFGAALLTIIIYLWFASTIMADAQELQLESPNKIFKHYCGKYLGAFYEIYTPIFLYLVLMVMISGAGATLTEYYGLNRQAGRIIMAVLALTTVLLGMTKLLQIVSRLGPAIIAFALIVGITNIIMNPRGIAHADEIMQTIKVTRAAPRWYISGIIFPSMGCLMLAPFLAKISTKAHSRKEAKTGGILGGLAFGLAVSIMCFGIMASIGELYDKQIPALFIAKKMVPSIGVIFSFILFAGIYTTAVPMLWLSCNTLIPDEKTRKFKIVAFILTGIAFIGGQFPFAKLVNILYPITGYLGILLMFCILIKQCLRITPGSGPPTVPTVPPETPLQF